MSKREFTVANEYQYDQSTPVRWVISHVTRHWPLLLLYLVGVLLTAAGATTVATLTGQAFDAVVGAADIALLTRLALIILGVVLLRGTADLVAQYSMEFIAKRLERDARDEIYLDLLGKSQTFHNRQRVGDIMARVSNDVREMNYMMMPGFSLLFDSMMAVVMPFIFIAFIDWRLLLAPTIFVITFYFALRDYTRKLNPLTWAEREQFGEMNAGLAETIRGIEVVKTTAQENQEKGKFFKNARLFRDYFVKQGQVQARYLPPLLLGFCIAIAFLHGLFLLNAGQLTVGQLVSYLGLMALFGYPAFISIFTFTLVELGLASAKRILELIKQETNIDENEAGHQATIQGAIRFEGVSFGYSPDKPILENLSFEIAPGQTVAIVGQTGSGKSTLSKLVNRTYDVQNGRLLIDNIDVRDWNLNTLRSQISTIEQDVFLFSRTIGDNIAFGFGQGVTSAQIEQAAKEAQAHDFIMSFADGYDTEIGERGVTLSGGQRQRLAIARALLTDPRILILDDATSAIDSATEDKIQTAIKRVAEGRTTLLITHRLSQIRRADHILVLQQGHIIDHGTHAELLSRCTLYQRIFARQEMAVS